jgi:hypothetical protein
MRHVNQKLRFNIKMTELWLLDCAKKIAKGFKDGDISPRVIGIGGAEIQRLYRGMRKENYQGSVSLYACKLIFEANYEEYKKFAFVAEKGELNLGIGRLTLAEAYCMHIHALFIGDEEARVTFRLLEDVKLYKKLIDEGKINISVKLP